MKEYVRYLSGSISIDRSEIDATTDLYLLLGVWELHQ
jgi:hypothetical protein